jgi:hypothetical protein
LVDRVLEVLIHASYGQPATAMSLLLIIYCYS